MTIRKAFPVVNTAIRIVLAVIFVSIVMLQVQASNNVRDGAPQYIKLTHWGQHAILLDPATGKPVVGAIINITWLLKKKSNKAKHLSGRKPRLYVQQVLSNNEGRFQLGVGDDKFRIPIGWKMSEGDNVIISIFHPQYQVVKITQPDKHIRKLPQLSGLEKGQQQEGLLIEMTGLSQDPFQRDINQEQLPREWKDAIEEEVVNFSWRGREYALASQMPLINGLRNMCNTMPTYLRTKCPSSDSYLMRFLNQYPQTVTARDQKQRQHGRELSKPSASFVAIPTLTKPHRPPDTKK